MSKLSIEGLVGKDQVLYIWQKLKLKLADKANTADLSKVATSGSYNDLVDKPTIPEGAVVDSALSNSSTNAVQNKVVYAELAKKSDTGHNHDDVYYTETEMDTKLANKANDSSVVHLAGAETITGAKTFTGNTVFSDGKLKVDDGSNTVTLGVGGTANSPKLSVDDKNIATENYVDEGLTNKANTATTLAGYGITDAYTKTETTSAIATAKQEAINAVLNGVTDDFDTLKEIAEWIQSDTTNSTNLINRVSAIEADYLVSSDIVALTNEEIDTIFAS